MKLGFQRINWQVGFYGDALYPKGGSRCTMRLQLSVPLPPKVSPEGADDARDAVGEGG